MAKSKVFWITRDERLDPDGFNSESLYAIWAYSCHPQKNEHGVWDYRLAKAGACEDVKPEVIALTGITLAPGERGKARLVTPEK